LHGQLRGGDSVQRMVTRTQQGAAGAVLVVGLAVALYFWARGGPPSTASADGAATGATGPVGAEPEVPRIDLARLEARQGEAGAVTQEVGSARTRRIPLGGK